ncbi:MAG: VCBS repeat-containing protein, partial [Caldilinea sp.]|nr:VCBS repeat-containing protein [Caldilinea sp.]
MNRPLLRSLRPLVAMAFAIFLLAIPVTVHAQDPDFSTDDPLEGQWELSRVTDLVLYQTHSADNNTKSQILNYYLETENSQIVTQTAKTILTAPCWLVEQREPQITRAGRFFALPNDVVITLAPSANAGNPDCASANGDSNMGLYIVDTQTNAAPIWVHRFASAKETAMAMADFNQDGLEDLFILNDTDAFVATATDIYSPTAGMTFGQRAELGSTTLAPKWDPVSADFNDDGLMDVAWIGQDSGVYFATVCPGSVAGTPCAGKQALDVLLNPLNSRTTALTAPNQNCAANLGESGQALVAGQFFDVPSGAGVAEEFGRLVVLGCGLPPSGPKTRAYSYKFDSQMTPTLVQFIDLQDLGEFLDVYAVDARLDWSSTADQVVFAVYIHEDVQYVYQVGVITFSGQSMSFHNQLFGGGANASPILGLASGHFASVPSNADSSDAFDLQIALALATSPPQIWIYDVDAPNNYTPSRVTNQTLDSSLGILAQHSAFNKLVAGDLQGRSDHLGPPTKIKVESHLQPAVVLAAPPMHADYVLPDQQTANGPAIVNFTAVPNAYNTAYTQGGSTSSNSARTDTTSYTYSYAESTDEKFSFNVPLVSSVSGEFKQSWKQQYDKTSTNYSYDKVEDDYSLAQASGLNDTIWYQSNDFYVYFYPVLGQSVCPVELPSCTADQMQPLYVSFSGPVDSTISPLDGGTTEWYQPVHEEGQIFSYAWDVSQLKTRFPESEVMSTEDVIFTTDSSPATQRSVKWITDSQQMTSTQNTYTHSFETDNSITVGGIDKDTGGAEFSGSFDYNSSEAMSTLNTSSTDIGAYTQIDLNRPAFPDGSLYRYSFQPLIISRSAPTGTAQSVGAPPWVYTTTGTIATEYFLEPPTSSQHSWGDWWGTSTNWYRQSIDIALNHPNRWNENGSDCDFTEHYAGQCIQPNLPQLHAFGAANDEPYISQWHHMRGLLVTVGAPGGPQRVAAQVGDTVYLQARVYNYSLVPMA